LRSKLYPTEFDSKAARLRSLLGQGVTVKVVVTMRGRETQHPEVAARTLQRMILVARDAGAEVSAIERGEASIQIRASLHGDDAW
jgi:translation initiation factor IF-3